MATSTGLSPAEARLLTALLRVDTPLSGRALARVTGLTQSTAGRALARLREAGLVVAEPAPPSLLYRPNSEHLSMPALLALLRVEEELRTRLADDVAGWQLSPASGGGGGRSARLRPRLRPAPAWPAGRPGEPRRSPAAPGRDR
jgi:DNA-binding transcriptional ArsR family regulator